MFVILSPPPLDSETLLLGHFCPTLMVLRREKLRRYQNILTYVYNSFTEHKKGQKRPKILIILDFLCVRSYFLGNITLRGEHKPAKIQYSYTARVLVKIN